MYKLTPISKEDFRQLRGEHKYCGLQRVVIDFQEMNEACCKVTFGKYKHAYMLTGNLNKTASRLGISHIKAKTLGKQTYLINTLIMKEV